MELKRQLGLGTATSVVVANIIGTGIFTTTGLMLARVESGGLVLLCWLLGGLIALSGALCYAELAVMMPSAGGEYVYLRHIYGPLPAFLSGWISFFVGFSAPIAAIGLAIVFYLSAAGALPENVWAGKTVAVGVILVLTVIHYCGTRGGAVAQNVLTVLKLLLIAGLLLAGLTAGKADFSFLDRATKAYADFWQGGEWSQMGIAMLWVMFAYSGWNAATYLGGEVKDPARTLPRSLLLGTVTVIVIYLLLNLFFFAAAPITSLSGEVAVGKVAVEHLFGDRAAVWLSWLIGLALLSSLSAYILVGPRVYYAMARDGLFFRAAATIHPKFHTPSYSILAQALCAVVLVLTGTFSGLLTYIGFALGLAPWLTVAGLMILRRREPGRERPYRVWGYPFVPLFYLLCSTGILVAAFLNSPGPSLAAIVTVLAGVPVYWVGFQRKRDVPAD